MKIAFRHVPFTANQLEELRIIAIRGGYETIFCSADTPPSAAELEHCEALLGYFPPNILKDLPHLKWIQTPADGVDRLCGDIYPNPDVQLTNCRVFGGSIAEYLMTGLLMLYRQMPAYLHNKQNHLWKNEGCARTIKGSLITVVGLGDIGGSFAERMHAMGARVRGVRRSTGIKADYIDELYSTAELHRAVDGADAIAVCLPNTPDTRSLISEKCIRHMKQNAIFLNAGRGITVDEEALIAALRKGRLGGAVLDVFTVEPLPLESPLWNMENVIVTPHISGHDDDPINAEQIFDIFKNNLLRFINGEPLINVIDRTRGY